jgi:hypothetical protein
MGPLRHVHPSSVSFFNTLKKRSKNETRDSITPSTFDNVKSTMIIPRRAFLAVASASASASLWTKNSFGLSVSVQQLQETVDLIPRQQKQAVPVLVPPVYIPSALIAGGFLLPANAYEPYLSTLHPIFRVRVVDYKEQELNVLTEETYFRDSDLWIGHSKGGKLVAKWMAEQESKSSRSSISSSKSSNSRFPSCCLIEPVDVDPPRGPHESILALWEQNLSNIARIPTLIVSAPFTETSRRYGKASNLCAPKDQDAQAFWEMACKARVSYPDQAASLMYVEFPTLGHNDVTSSALGGCADGPDRGVGAVVVAMLVRSWAIHRDDPLSAIDDFHQALAESSSPSVLYNTKIHGVAT